MTEQANLKVYELAKELGIDSISLLDKLKSLNIKVKNHMSDLGPEEVTQARTALRPAAPTKKTPAARKTVSRAKKTTDGEAAPAAKTTKSKAKAAEPVEAAPAAKAASPVIRRRVKSDGETETVSPASLHRPVQAEAEQVATEEAEQADQSMESEELAAQATQAQQLEPEAPAQATPGQGISEPVQPAASAAGTPAAGGAAPTRTMAPLTPRPVAPRKSFLKIVEPTIPPPRPVIKPAPAPGTKPAPGVRGTTTQDKDGFRIIKMTKENLDQMAEEEAAKKRGGGGRVPEIRPEDVRFADYRKKEMVFLPKKKKLPVGKEVKRTQITEKKAGKRIVQMQATITVQDFANQLGVKANEIIRKLMGMGQMTTLNASIDFDTATLIAAEYKYEVKNVAFNEGTLLGAAEQDAPETLVTRPPIVTIMGHVDHGKTTLLDSLREANVAAGEAGGITQHIGAYTVEKNGKLITFIDTPGHEAFTVMRARGANVTDIVILVVSADDGVMPQTREALSHAQAAKVPIIVAMNKIDKPGANPEKIKQGLAELNLLAEDWGGQTPFIPVSALKKTNLDKLLEAILLQSEIMELKANANTRASGTVLEARLEKGRGPVVSLLVSRGTLRVGDAVVSGPYSGKVKAMMDDKGKTVKEVLPGIAAEVLGFEGVPNAGEKFASADDEAGAREIAQHRVDVTREKAAASVGKITLDQLFSKIKAGDMKELAVVLKADVFGSVEAIRDSLIKLSNEKVTVKVIHAAPGGVTESDVLLASASNAIILGFGVRPETKARQLAEAEHVDIRSYTIIYELIDDVKKAMTGLLDKLKVEKFLGRAEVRQIFSVPKIGVIAGTSVVDGKIIRGANVRLLRDSRVIFEGKLGSLKRFKDDAKEVATGFECGIGIENYNDLKPGDIIEAYQIELVAPELNA
jgi:translation initiation factor IF-2